MFEFVKKIIGALAPKKDVLLVTAPECPHVDKVVDKSINSTGVTRVKKKIIKHGVMVWPSSLGTVDRNLYKIRRDTIYKGENNGG